MTSASRPRRSCRSSVERKDEMADPATAPRQAGNFWEETGATVYEAYQRELAEADAVDFDDLLLRVVLLFEQHPDVLARYQRRWSYLLVDEYQDTNRVQYRLCRLLSAVHRNLAVVGDDDQSIYSLARGGPAQHPRLRAGLARCEGRQARAELPIHPDHPRCRPRGGVPPGRPQGQAAVDRSGGGGPDLRVRRLQRVRGGRVRGPPGGAPGLVRRPAARLVGAAHHAGRGRRSGAWGAPLALARRPDRCASGTSRSPTGSTPRAGSWKRRSCALASRTSWWAGSASTSGARSRTRWPTRAWRETPPTGWRSSGW